MDQLFDICKSYNLRNEKEDENVFRIHLIRWVIDANTDELEDLQTVLLAMAAIIKTNKR